MCPTTDVSRGPGDVGEVDRASRFDQEKLETSSVSRFFGARFFGEGLQ